MLSASESSAPLGVITVSHNDEDARIIVNHCGPFFDADCISDTTVWTEMRIDWYTMDKQEVERLTLLLCEYFTQLPTAFASITVLCYCSMSTNTVIALLHLDHDTLRHVILDAWSFEDEGLNVLATNQSLETLMLQAQDTEDKSFLAKFDTGLDVLPYLLERNQTLRSLRLSFPPGYLDRFVNVLPYSFSNNHTLTELDLSYSKIDADHMVQLAHVLRQTTTLRSLCLRSFGITESSGLLDLADALKVNVSLTNLSLPYNHLGHAGVRALADALKRNTTLKSLNVSSTHLDDQDAKVLADALEADMYADSLTLTTLILSFNKIGVVGVTALASALEVNNSLHTLALEGNSFGDAGTLRLCRTLETNTSLQEVTAFLTGTAKPVLNQLADAVAKNTV